MDELSEIQFELKSNNKLSASWNTPPDNIESMSSLMYILGQNIID